MKSFYHNKIFILLLFIFVTYSSGYALSTIYPMPFYIEFIFCYIFLFSIISRFNLNKIDLIGFSFLLIMAMISITFFINGFSSASFYFSLILKVIIAFGIVTVYSFDDFISVFKKSMIFISFLSIICYIFTQSGLMIRILPILDNINSVPYGIGYLYFYLPWIPEQNIGVFWEPGLYSSFLVIAIIFELFYNENEIKLWKLALYIFTILTTKSSAGYGLLFFIVVLLIMWKFSTIFKNSYGKILMPMLFILSIIFLLNYEKIIEADCIMKLSTFGK